MIKISTLKENIQSGALDSRFARLDSNIQARRERFAALCDDYAKHIGSEGEIRLFSAPGRTEVGGNHTDHNHGKVLAASINLDVIALASVNDKNIITVKSKGYEKTDVVDLSVLTPVAGEEDHSAALIRGTAARFKELGYNIGGFNAVTVSQVLSGSGLSSSAAFEVLIGTILNYMYNDGKISPVEIAQIAQYAENKFFGKPCGLMDQMACSVGGFVEIDFKDPAAPIIEPVNFDFASCRHSLCIVDTRADHADLTDEYAAIRREMEAAAACFSKSCLREVEYEQFLGNISTVREKCNDRAVLRALHFFAENKRVDAESAALKANNFDEFKKLVIESGFSSYMYNQNVFSALAPTAQPVSLALSISQNVLEGKGAWRVHGGGFAGTIQAFVPNELVDDYIAAIEKVFGEGACYVLAIRAVGGAEL